MNLGMVQKAIDAGKLDAKAVIDQAALQRSQHFPRGGKDGVRLLAKGELTTKADASRWPAPELRPIAAVEKAGGKVEVH